MYFYNKKNYQSSLDFANQLISIDGKDAEYFYYRGMSYLRLKKYEYAILDLDKAIDISPRVAPYYYSERASYYYEQKEYIKANNDLDIAISIDKKNSHYLLERASNNIYLTRFDDALSDIKKAKSLGANKSNLYHTYSNYYRLKNDYNKAFQYIQKAEGIRKDFRFTGTKATIYASMEQDDDFYKYLEIAFENGAEAYLLYPDIKDKYKKEPKFIDLLKKYNQELF